MCMMHDIIHNMDSEKLSQNNVLQNEATPKPRNKFLIDILYAHSPPTSVEYLHVTCIWLSRLYYFNPTNGCPNSDSAIYPSSLTIDRYHIIIKLYVL